MIGSELPGEQFVTNLIKEIVSFCAARAAHRDSLRYDPQIFWELYKRIADEFDKHFAQMDPTILPVRLRQNPERFFEGMRRGFILAEVESISDTEPQFADLVVKAAREKTRYFYFTEKIDTILRARFGIED